MNLYQWFKYCITNKYADFDGRARREEYWSFALVNVIIYGVLQLLAHISNGLGGMVFNVLILVYCLAVLIPGIAVAVRRLHDAGYSGYWVLLGFVPVIGLVIIYFLVKDSERGNNRFGPSSKYPEEENFE